MERYLGIAWLIATVNSWISFGVASWFLADNFEPGAFGPGHSVVLDEHHSLLGGPAAS